MLAETPRGATPRYWDDVQVGEEIDTITKGPIGLTDEIAFVASGAAPIPRLAAHGVALRRYRKHPRWAYRDPTTHALACLFRALQRLRGSAPRGAGGLRRRHPAHVLADPRAHELDG